MHFELLDELVIIFLLSIVVNLVCNKIKLTATVGFLLTGVLCGPSLLGIVDSQSISDVAGWAYACCCSPSVWSCPARP